MVYNRSDLIQACDRGQRFKYIFFWGHRPAANGLISESCLSQWWTCRFLVDGVEYSCAEQYMMAEKARMFGASANLREIMNAKDPKTMKAYGRAVQRFDQQRWEKNCRDIVKAGNMAKFSQNPRLWAYLKSTGNRILVEASPFDRIWGIGMGKTDPDALDPSKWRGKNLLGFVLTEVRDLLLEAEKGGGCV